MDEFEKQLTVDIWPWSFAWTSLLSMVITPENFMMIWWGEHSEKGVIKTDRWTERSVLRAAWSQLKTQWRPTDELWWTTITVDSLILQLPMCFLKPKWPNQDLTYCPMTRLPIQLRQLLNISFVLSLQALTHCGLMIIYCIQGSWLILIQVMACCLTALTHLPLELHICISEQGQYWFR